MVSVAASAKNLMSPELDTIVPAATCFEGYLDPWSTSTDRYGSSSSSPGHCSLGSPVFHEPYRLDAGRIFLHLSQLKMLQSKQMTVKGHLNKLRPD